MTDDNGKTAAIFKKRNEEERLRRERDQRDAWEARRALERLRRTSNTA